MKYYKDEKNQVYAYEADGSQDAYIPETLVPITEAEAYELINPPETLEQTIARLEAALDRHLDSVANSYRYDSIRTMATYDGDPFPKFDAEGKAAKAWRSACYALSIEIMEDVLAGNRGVPTESELIAEMPLITDYLTY